MGAGCARLFSDDFISCCRYGTAFVTVGVGAGGADGAAMEDQTVAEIVALLWRQNFPQLLFHLPRVLGAIGEAQAAGDADAVGVGNDHPGGVVDISQNEVGGLSAHSGQLEKVLHGIGDLAAKVGQNHLGGSHNVLCLGPEEAAGVDELLYLVDVGFGKGL